MLKSERFMNQQSTSRPFSAVFPSGATNINIMSHMVHLDNKRIILISFSGKRKLWRAFLLYGPLGTRKSYLAKAVATKEDSTLGKNLTNTQQVTRLKQKNLTNTQQVTRLKQQINNYRWQVIELQQQILELRLYLLPMMLNCELYI